MNSQIKQINLSWRFFIILILLFYLIFSIGFFVAKFVFIEEPEPPKPVNLFIVDIECLQGLDSNSKRWMVTYVLDAYPQTIVFRDENVARDYIVYLKTIAKEWEPVIIPWFDAGYDDN